MNLLTKFGIILLSGIFSSASDAGERIRIRMGDDVSHQSYRFREYFPDHDWGNYRDRHWYGGPGTSISLSTNRFSIYYSEGYRRKTGLVKNARLTLSEESGRNTLESFFEKAKISYIKDVRLNLGNGRVQTVDFMVELDDWVPVEYVPEEMVLPLFQKNKKIYDAAAHSKKYILIPPSTKEELESRIMQGFNENCY